MAEKNDTTVINLTARHAELALKHLDQDTTTTNAVAKDLALATAEELGRLLLRGNRSRLIERQIKRVLSAL
jgi:hypothetical protein